MIIGMSIRASICQILERIRKVDSVGREASKRIHVVRRETDKDSIDYGRKLVKPLKIEKNKNGQKKKPKT